MGQEEYKRPAAVAPICSGIIVPVRSDRAMNEKDPTDRKPARTSSRRGRPLSLIQETLLVTAAFVVGGALQLLILLRIGGVIE